MLKNKRILITGATGFVGANLARHFLKKGANISIFTRKASDIWRIRDILKHIAEYQVGLEDENKINRIIPKIKPEIVLHAAVYGAYPSQNNAKKIIETNFTGTVNLLNACRKADVEVFVNTGSSSEYGIKDEPMREDSMLEPISEYGVSKAAATLFCQAVAKKEKRIIATLRLFSPYGYYEEPFRLIPSLVLSCLKSENPKLSSPDSVRDFIFIEDVVEAYEKVISHKDKAGGEIFNIGSGKQHTVREIADEIIKLAGNKVQPEWRVMPNLRYEPLHWQADIRKAEKILNWYPENVLEKGLFKNIRWYKEFI
jgi:nucleoside-diphosphate-sugar epimerase